MGKAIVVLGVGGHGRVLVDLLRTLDDEFDIAGGLDPDPALRRKSVMGVPILGGDEMLQQLRQEGVSCACIGVGSIGDNSSRRRLFQIAIEAGFQLPVLVHPDATVSASAVLGDGTVVFAQAVVNPQARLGLNSIVSTGSVIEHDCLVGDHVHVSPSATLCGGVRVGDDCHIGAGAVVREGCVVGSRSIVGAGAVVVRNVEENVVVAGVPSRILRNRNPAE